MFPFKRAVQANNMIRYKSHGHLEVVVILNGPYKHQINVIY